MYDNTMLICHRVSGRHTSQEPFAHAWRHTASQCHYLESSHQASLKLCDPCYSLLASASVHAIIILVGCINCRIVSFRCQCTAWACCSGTSWSSPCEPAAAASERPQQLASNSDAESARCVLSTCCLRCSMPSHGKWRFIES